MSRRTTGTLFLAIAVLLHITRYLSAAIFGSSLTNWSSDLFNVMLQYIGPGLVRWSAAALVVGIGYLTWAEVEAWQARNQVVENPNGSSLKFNIEEVNYVIHPDSD